MCDGRHLQASAEMLKDEAPEKWQLTAEAQTSSNPFTEAVLSFIDELKYTEDKKSLFYQQVFQVAYRLHNVAPLHGEGPAGAEDLLSYVKELDEQHQKKSRVRRVFASAQPLVEGLMQYTAALDVMVQAGPSAVSLIYGGAKLVLQLANGHNKCYEEVTQMMADIGHQLKYFEIYTRAFAADKYLSGIICSAYKDILLFWRDASDILSQRGKRFLFRGVLAPFSEKYAPFRKKIDRNAQNVRMMAAALHIEAQGRFSENQTIQTQGIVSRLESLQNPTQPQYSDSGAVKHGELQRWISGGRYSRIDPQSDFDRHLRSRHTGTCQWVFEHPNFRQWHLEAKTSCLWLHAAPGSGKSVLSASIIEKLQSLPGMGTSNVIYFFCNGYDPEKCQAVSVLRSLAIQALKLTKYIPDELNELYQEEFSPKDCFLSGPNIAERVLLLLLKRLEYVVIIVDGLDECQESSPNQLLIEVLSRLCIEKTYGIVKWLFTSRDDATIRRNLESNGCMQLSVPKHSVQADIRTFLEDNISIFQSTSSQLDRITRLSDGNFLMIRLTIDPYRNAELTCSEEFEEAFETLQPELGRCWLRSLQKLLTRSVQVQELARVIISSVILAIQPMSLNEVIDLSSIKIGEQDTLQRQRTKSVILSACSPFIEIDIDGNFINRAVRLTHKSIGDLLTQDPSTLTYITPNCYKFFIKNDTSDTEFGLRCLTYLSYESYADFDRPELGGPHSNHFLKYAATYWYKHFDNASDSEAIFQAVAKFLRSPNFWTCLRVQSRYAPYLFARLIANTNKEGFYLRAPRGGIQRRATDFDQNAPEEYYADPLPSWLRTFGIEGENLVRGYHLLIREWGDTLSRFPDKIHPYFGEALGLKTFFHTNQCIRNKIKLLTLASSWTKLPPNLSSENQLTFRKKRARNPPLECDGPFEYARKIFQSYQGTWIETESITLLVEGLSAFVRQYKLSIPVFEGDKKRDDSDDSDEDENENNDKVSTENSKTTNTHILFFSVQISNHQTLNLHYVSGSVSTQPSLPLLLERDSWFFWPHTESSALFISIPDGRTIECKLPGHLEENMVTLANEYNYSPATKSLHRVLICHLPSYGLVFEHTCFSLPSLPDTVDPQPSEMFMPSSKTESWTYPDSYVKMLSSYSWLEADLYIAFGWPAVKVLHFPIHTYDELSSAEYNKPQIRIYKDHLCIPSSAFERGVCFLIQTPAGADSLHAIFLLDPLPTMELPAVMLDFELDGEKWEEFDPSLMADELGDPNEFMKGSYASKDQHFTLPIRSGADWRRRAHISCW